jgi:general secretion pathway protein L
MSTLVVLLPPRARLGPATESPAEGEAMPAEYSYAFSPDGLTLTKQGEAAPDVLPKADSVVAVVGDLDLSWHPITCPKAPAARLRAALAGVLEELLLDDESHLALALAPQAAAGKATWVAAVHKAWLTTHLARLEKAGQFVERVVPASWPDEAAQGHFFSADVAADGSSANTWLVRSDGQGVHPVRLSGSLAQAAIQRWQLEPTRWTAQPAVAAQAERWLGAPVLVQTDAERGLQAVRSLWNLRQFDLAPRHRGVRALRDLFKQWRGPAWKPVRWGLAALLLLQLLGLNLWAWHEKRAVEDRRQAQVALLKAAHPQVRAVLEDRKSVV